MGTTNKTSVNNVLLQDIEKIVNKYGNEADNLIAVLLDLQDLNEAHYLTREAIVGVAEVMGLEVQNVYEVATFYHALSTTPKGKYVIELCQGTACTVNKQKSIRLALEKELGIKMGETTLDNLFTIQYTPCFGACDVSPAMRLNKKVYGNLTEDSLKKILDECRRGLNE